MDKLTSGKVIPAYKKTIPNNRTFYKQHISGSYKTTKTTNHVGNFDEGQYHKVLNKMIKKPRKKLRKLVLKEGQYSYIVKGVTVRELGMYKKGLSEETLSAEVAGRDGNAGGVIPEHLHRVFESLPNRKGEYEGTEIATSPGGTEYTMDCSPRPYEGYTEQAIAEEDNGDLNFFLEKPNWMDSASYGPNPMDYEEFPELSRK